MRRLWHAALDLLYPPRCCGCDAPVVHPGFCAPCQDAIRPPETPLCPVCGLPFTVARAMGASHPDHRCGPCLRQPPRFERARARAVYRAGATRNPLRHALHQYKYGRDVTLARPLGALFSGALPRAAADYDLIVPVPLHLSRLRWRGFNQAQLLARPLSRATHLPIEVRAVERVKATRAQVELGETERRTNVRGAFRVTAPARVRGRRILLVDDVFTTGATVNECAATLQRAGARGVDVLVLARAVLD